MIYDYGVIEEVISPISRTKKQPIFEKERN